MTELCLGTVQFGVRYGIHNVLQRKPNLQEIYDILEEAINAGIKFFDTASIYGNAENVLGNFGIGRYPVRVISKLPPQEDSAVSNIMQQIKQSLRYLQLDCLDGYMLHDPQDFYKPSVLNGLCEAKKVGLVNHIGVSIYEPEDALNVVNSSSVDYIQIPYNVFDRRLDQTDFFMRARENGIKVFARSAFLQGLLLMKENEIPDKLLAVEPYLKRFHAIIDEFGYTPAEAAMLFSYSHEGIDVVVFGVDTKSQLAENLLIFEKKYEEYRPCYEVLKKEFLSIERQIIIPSLW